MSKDMCPSDQEIESIFRMAREGVRFFSGLAGALSTLERAEGTSGSLLAGWSTNRGEPLGTVEPDGLAFALHTATCGDRHAAAPEHATPDGSLGQSERAPVQNNTVQAAE